MNEEKYKSVYEKLNRQPYGEIVSLEEAAILVGVDPRFGGPVINHLVSQGYRYVPDLGFIPPKPAPGDIVLIRTGERKIREIGLDTPIHEPTYVG